MGVSEPGKKTAPQVFSWLAQRGRFLMRPGGTLAARFGANPGCDSTRIHVWKHALKFQGDWPLCARAHALALKQRWAGGQQIRLSRFSGLGKVPVPRCSIGVSQPMRIQTAAPKIEPRKPLLAAPPQGQEDLAQGHVNRRAASTPRKRAPAQLFVAQNVR